MKDLKKVLGLWKKVLATLSKMTLYLEVLHVNIVKVSTLVIGKTYW